MSEPVITLALSAGNLVVFNGSRSRFTSLNRGVYLTRIYLRKPNPDFIPGQEETVPFDATLYDGLRVGIWQDNPGTDANQLTLTDQTGWTYNADDEDAPYFEGYINTETTEVEEWMDTSCTKDCYFAIGLVSGADVTPILTNTCTANFTLTGKVDPGSGIGVGMTSSVPRIPLPCHFVQSGVTYLAQIIPGTPNVLDISEI